MKKIILTFAVFFALLFVTTLGFRLYNSTLGFEGGEKPVSELRIVTMAPSSGEVVFALGLGEQVVGVSRFATFPPEVFDKPKIGGYLDIDMEALLSLNADVVVVLKEQLDLADRLRKFGIDVVAVDHMSIAGIKDSIEMLGAKFDKIEEANSLLEDMQNRIQIVSESNHSQGDPPSMLLSIGRELGEGKVNGLVAAGSAGVHQELLELAGYSNSYKGRENFPQITKEHIIKSNPKFIVDMVNTKDLANIGVDAIRADWDGYQELRAVRDGKVFVLSGDQHFIPGPRFCDTLEWLASLRQEVKNE